MYITYLLYISRAGVAFANARITLSDNFSGSGLGECTVGFFYARSTIEGAYVGAEEDEEKKKKRGDTGEAEKETKTKGPRSIHGGVRGRALSTYLPNAPHRLLGPPTTFTTG